MRRDIGDKIKPRIVCSFPTFKQTPGFVDMAIARMDHVEPVSIGRQLLPAAGGPGYPDPRRG